MGGFLPCAALSTVARALQPGLFGGGALFPGGDLVRMLEREPDIVETFEQAHAVGGRDIEIDDRAAGAADGLRREIDRERGGAVGGDDARAAKASPPAPSSSSGSTPFCRQFSRKISAKPRATTQRIPHAMRAHTAVSRADPQPKFLQATKIAASWNSGRLRTKSASWRWRRNSIAR